MLKKKLKWLAVPVFAMIAYTGFSSFTENSESESPGLTLDYTGKCKKSDGTTGSDCDVCKSGKSTCYGGCLTAGWSCS